jgi:hypothetical protein
MAYPYSCGGAVVRALCSGFEARHCNVVIWGLVHSTITEYLAGRDGFVTD